MSQYCERLQQFLFCGCQTIDARSKHSLYGSRWFNSTDRPREFYDSIALEHLFFEQCLYHFFHEKWCAFGALDDQPLECGEIATFTRHRTHLLILFRNRSARGLVERSGGT